MHEINMKLGFDPNKSECAHTRKIFNEPTATTLYLLWRRGHIVDQNFPEAVLMVAELIDRHRPKDAKELERCFRCPHLNYGTFSFKDVETFCDEFLDYFTGVKTVGFEIAPNA